MRENRNNALITAAVALALVLAILAFASASPWLLAGVPPVLAGIATVIRAINNAPGRTNESEDVKQEDETEEDAPPVGDSKS
ncbi:hypothetical protein [Amycolatopsis sp. NPDC021455]|uniref:hypothetical protein n=1 Tax=Amycolatopsis sp. NPDC021455 TaxID=3154901 RepID=UPI003411EB71